MKVKRNRKRDRERANKMHAAGVMAYLSTSKQTTLGPAAASPQQDLQMHLGPVDAFTHSIHQP